MPAFGTRQINPFQRKPARDSESVTESLAKYRMPRLITSLPTCPPRKFRRKDSSLNAHILPHRYRYPNRPGKEVEILATGSNNKQAPIDKQAARLRRAYSSQKMRRSLFERAPPPSTAAPAAGSGKPPAPGSAKSKQLVKEFLQSKSRGGKYVRFERH